MRRFFMQRNKGIAWLCILAVAAGMAGGCTVQVPEETETSETVAALPPARAQDDYYRFINEETLANAEFEYGEQTAGEAFDAHLVQDQVEGIINDCVAGSGYRTGTEEYVIQNAYNSFMAYDFESGEVPEQLDQILHEIDDISSVEEYLSMDARLARDYGVPEIFNFNIDTNYLGVDEYILGFENIRGVVDVDFKTLEDSYAPLDSIKTYGSSLMQAMGHDREEADEMGTEFGYLAMDLYNATDLDILNELMPFMYVQELSIDEIEQVFSNIDFAGYLEDYGITGIDRVSVVDMGQLEAINNMLTEDNLDALKVWLMCRFASKYQRFIAGGYPELEAYASIDYASPEEQAMDEVRHVFVGCTDVLYVEQYWSDEQDEALRAMCDDIRDGYRNIISDAAWLSEETRQGCLEKLDNMVYVTASDTGRHDPSYYANLTYDNYLDLYIQMQQIGVHEQISHLYEEYDRTSTWMYMQDFNACYNPSFNNITITVAITNSPFFDVNADYYTNLGGLGMVIGHEMGHAFDSNCILFNAQGAYDPDWIPAEDYQTLVERNQAAVTYFEDYFTIFGVYHVDGEQTLGENYADLGSMECITSLAHNDDELRLLFENYARIWCSKTVDEGLIDQIATDEHSPAIIRVNAILATLDSFYEVYDVQPGDGMYIAPENRVSRWY